MVLRFSSDRDDLTIFGGLKFSISGFFLARKILASIFLGSLISVGIFLGIQNNLMFRATSRVSRPRCSASKAKPDLFCDCFNI